MIDLSKIKELTDSFNERQNSGKRFYEEMMKVIPVDEKCTEEALNTFLGNLNNDFGYRYDQYPEEDVEIIDKIAVRFCRDLDEEKLKDNSFILYDFFFSTDEQVIRDAKNIIGKLDFSDTHFLHLLDEYLSSTNYGPFNQFILAKIIDDEELLVRILKSYYHISRVLPIDVILSLSQRLDLQSNFFGRLLHDRYDELMSIYNDINGEHKQEIKKIVRVNYERISNVNGCLTPLMIEVLSVEELALLWLKGMNSIIKEMEECVISDENCLLSKLRKFGGLDDFIKLLDDKLREFKPEINDDINDTHYIYDDRVKRLMMNLDSEIIEPSIDFLLKYESKDGIMDFWVKYLLVKCISAMPKSQLAQYSDFIFNCYSSYKADNQLQHIDLNKPLKILYQQIVNS